MHSESLQPDVRLDQGLCLEPFKARFNVLGFLLTTAIQHSSKCLSRAYPVQRYPFFTLDRFKAAISLPNIFSFRNRGHGLPSFQMTLQTCIDTRGDIIASYVGEKKNKRSLQAGKSSSLITSASTALPLLLQWIPTN
jgi:hypothetical protein